MSKHRSHPSDTAFSEGVWLESVGLKQQDYNTVMCVLGEAPCLGEWLRHTPLNSAHRGSVPVDTAPRQIFVAHHTVHFAAGPEMLFDNAATCRNPAPKSPTGPEMLFDNAATCLNPAPKSPTGDSPKVVEVLEITGACDGTEEVHDILYSSVSWFNNPSALGHNPRFPSLLCSELLTVLSQELWHNPVHAHFFIRRNRLFEAPV
ncbi:hypothetical protein FQR65_LT10585 [Abscondita terminalis]|nr:hypothetical protein FQR65_LT10585 [Abscondita terminalis]